MWILARLVQRNPRSLRAMQCQVIADGGLPGSDGASAAAPRPLPGPGSRRRLTQLRLTGTSIPPAFLVGWVAAAPALTVLDLSSADLPPELLPCVC